MELVPIVLLGFFGCVQAIEQPRSVRDAEVISRTRETLEAIVDGHRWNLYFYRNCEEKIAPNERYEIEQCNRALALLKGASVSDFVHPEPIMAELSRPKASTILEVVCLAAEENITLVCLNDSEGRELGRGRLKYSYFSEGLVRSGITVVAAQPGSKNVLFPTMILDPKCLDQELWVSLLDDQGTLSGRVRVFVGPAILDKRTLSSDVARPVR